MKMKIFVAVHKSAKLYGDSSYQFIHVGATMHPDVAIEGTLKDNVSDDNISDRNDAYCELTGIYHIWKNIHDVEYVGLCHYRRYLSHKQYSLDYNNVILKKNDYANLLNHYDIILPKKTSKHRSPYKGYIKDETLKQSFRLYKLCMPILQMSYPEYVNELENEFSLDTMYCGNIMVCNKKIFDEYCTWLFGILFEVQKNLELKGKSFHIREAGLLSEWLLNVWIRQHKEYNVYETSVIFIEECKSRRSKLIFFLNQIGFRSVIQKIGDLIWKVKEKKHHAEVYEYFFG